MLSFDEFKEQLKKEVVIRYPGVEIEEREVTKINGKHIGIVLYSGKEFSPVIYPENLYEPYKELEDMELVMDILDSVMRCENIEESKDIVQEWEKAKVYVKPFVFDLEKNRECIECHEYVCREKIDLAYGVHVDLPLITDGENASVIVTKRLMEMWGVTESELFDVAEQNADFKVKPMRTVISELMGEEVEVENENADAMFVVSNTRRYRGAAGMFDVKLMHDEAERLNTNFYILPSSVHEVILVKEESVSSIEILKEMVCEINQTQVRPEEYLSDSVYYYNRETGKISILV